MFLVPIKSPGITMRRIRQVDGGNEFCEEFFVDLELGDDAVVGEVNGGRALVRRAVHQQLIGHVYHGVLDGSLPAAAGSIIRISHAETIQFEIDTALAIVGAAGVVDDGSGLSRFGDRFLSRQTAPLGGRTNEIARTIIGERILGFPREYAADRGVPFNQVKRKRD